MEQLELQIKTVTDYFNRVNWKKIGLVALIFFFVVIAQVIIHAIIVTISIFPVLPGLLQLIGLIVAIRFSYRNLLTAENRAKLWERIKTKTNEVLN